MITKEALDQLLALASTNHSIGAHLDGFNFDQRPVMALPQGVELHDLEGYLRAPVRIRAQRHFALPKDLIDYINKHKQADSAVYVDNKEFRCVIDENGKDAPAWREHTATMRLDHSREMQDWFNRNEIWQDQLTFAQFIEERKEQFVSPIGLDMLEIARHLEATQTSQFKSAVRLQNGDRKFVYETTTATRSEKGELAVPDRFKIRIPIYKRHAGADLSAWLRYRIKEGELAFSYKLERLDQVEEALIDGLAEHLAQATQLPVLFTQ